MVYAAPLYNNNYNIYCPPIFLLFLPHFRLYEVVSLHRCVLPYKYREILGMLRKLLKVCFTNGEQVRSAMPGYAAFDPRYCLFSYHISVYIG